jgi:hypothetical protein
MALTSYRYNLCTMESVDITKHAATGVLTSCIFKQAEGPTRVPVDLSKVSSNHGRYAKSMDNSGVSGDMILALSKTCSLATWLKPLVGCSNPSLRCICAAIAMLRQ